MNIPNKLTILRIILVPIFIVFLMIDAIPHNMLYALLIFAVASFTDFLDGYIARKNHLITNFGKFLDPLADKVLVFSAMICFIELGLASSVAVALMIAREFLVTSLRLVAVSSDGNVIAASFLGKLKTVTQMVWIIIVLFLVGISSVFSIDTLLIQAISDILMWITTFITVLSGISYIYNNRQYIVSKQQ